MINKIIKVYQINPDIKNIRIYFYMCILYDKYKKFVIKQNNYGKCKIK